MSAPEPRHEKENAPPTRAVNPPEVVLVTTGSKEVGDVSEQYQTRDDLEKARRVEEIRGSAPKDH